MKRTDEEVKAYKALKKIRNILKKNELELEFLKDGTLTTVDVEVRRCGPGGFVTSATSMYQIDHEEIDKILNKVKEKDYA